MDSKILQQLLEEVQGGRLPVAEAVERLRTLPFEDLGFARVDHHRQLRQGFPEVVFAAGKSLEQVRGILTSLTARADHVLVTRLAPEAAAALQLVEQRQTEPPIVFCPVRFLQQREARFPPHPLPHGWSVTSDSIAARIAGILDAEELVLLKSADPPAPLQPPYVDEYFVQAAAGLTCVRSINLRRYA